MKCIDTQIGNILFFWELKMLPEAQNGKFEEHLFECDSCADEVYQGINNAQLLREYRKSALDERYGENRN